MSINPNKDNYDLDLDRLEGLSWVRFVYWASRENQSPAAAFHARYRKIIQSYAAIGVKSLIILHQDTGRFPPDRDQESSPRWAEYADAFANVCQQIARVCAEFGDMVAYQIYNETDSGYKADAGNPNPSALGLPPRYYALILDKATQAIRAVDPQATIVLGGLKTGAANAIDYLKKVETELGQLPVDALAGHPYGQFVNFAPFNYAQIGRLPDYLRLWKNAFSDLPLWITEIGCPRVPVGEEHHEPIARYMKEVITEIADNQADHVPVLIWFSWANNSENAGVLRTDGTMKSKIDEAYQLMLERNQAAPESDQEEDPGDMAGEADAEFVSFTPGFPNLSAVPAGTTFTSSWTFKNTGETTWGDGYQVAYSPKGNANEAPLTASHPFDMQTVADSFPVAPGSEVTIALEMTAPDQVGQSYTSHWVLRAPDGEAFGNFWTKIIVTQPEATTSVPQPDMVFIRDVGVVDDMQLVAGSDFDKQWLVRNTGARQWGSAFRLVYIGGDLQMARGKVAHMVPVARPGDEVILTVPMTVPPALNGQPTTYTSQWRLQDDRENLFGDPIWAKIVATTAVSTTTANNTPLARLLNDPSIWYSQLDPRWASDALGFGTTKMRDWGCLLVCMAMTVSAFGIRKNPQELNQKLREINARTQVFTNSDVWFRAPQQIVTGLRRSSNLASWPNSNVPNTALPATGQNPLDRIDQALAQGNIVFAQVDTKLDNGVYNSRSDQHWVIIVKRTPTGDDYLILNPLISATDVQRQPLSLMAKYGRRNPNRTHDENLRDAIMSTMIYYQNT